MKAEELKYSKDHIWVHTDGDMATIGLSDFAQNELGDIVFVEMPEVGKSFGKGDAVGTVESVKSVSDILAPISGEVAETNKLLEDSPETINKDPYGDGWVMKAKVSDKGEIAGLLDYNSYMQFTESEM
ncbi:MAG: glycine cleavage system protein H [Spirochaetes bacterium DG_61]|jgi:glycine cleavage system H protein|nr:MAG: glycine cleavage system protein H [Spirochaetes bacterium DG_61]